jgi:hypothetical protein
MSLSTVMFVYGVCLYVCPTLTIATTVGTISFVGTRIIFPRRKKE